MSIHVCLIADKKPKPQEVDVYTIKATSAQTAATSGRLLRVVRRTLADLWQRGCTVRIQNFGDREHRPHSEKDIRNQVRAGSGGRSFGFVSYAF